nr:MFS transporter [Rubrobacter calidifluminis]
MSVRRGVAGRSRVRWLMVVLAFFGIAINYIDRANLGVAATHIQKELGIGDFAMGLALGAFFYTYAFFQLPMGYWVDRFGARLVYTVAVVWWSVFTAATGLARNFASLFGFRLLLGAGEAGGYPSCAKVVSQWFPKQERAFATSIFDSGARVGTALSLPIVAGLIGAFGWRVSFAVTGALGIVWAIFWVLLYRSPRRHPRVSEEELRYIEAGGARTADYDRSRQPQRRANEIRWRDLFRYRTIWGMMIGFFCLNFVIYFFITWFPSYLVKARGFDLLQLGIFGTIPAIVAIPGGWVGGLFSDFLVRRGASLTVARKVCLVGGMLFSSVIALAALVPTAAGALALLSVSYASLTFAAASVWSLPADVAPQAAEGSSVSWVASIGGIQNFASNLAGIASPAVLGAVLGATGSFVGGLITAGVLAIVGALSYLFIVGRVEPLPAERTGSRESARVI